MLLGGGGVALMVGDDGRVGKLPLQFAEPRQRFVECGPGHERRFRNVRSIRELYGAAQGPGYAGSTSTPNSVKSSGCCSAARSC